MRVLFTLQYLGTRYAGWQAQANAVGVQQVIEEALARMYGSPIRIEGASRTDSGVHAAAQRAHADLPFEIPARGLVRGLNDLLPSDIRVLAVATVDDDFHCRFAARGKTYVYRILNAEVDDVFLSGTHVHVGQELDVESMNAAARQLVGEHDFALFTVASPEVSSTRRRIESLQVQRHGNVLNIVVSADGFLRYMVRRIAGSLIEVGRGKLQAAAIWSEARWTAPSKGLTLLDVKY